jgi:hypothetical protein
MDITLVDDPELIARVGQSGSFGQRSDGLHLSDIYKRLMIRLQPKKYGREIDADALRRMEVGILFENILERGLMEKFATVRPGELFSPEGIAMSPDGVNPNLIAGEEYKATWKSCRGGLVDGYGMPLDKYIVWFIQMKGYAKWLEVLRFILRVLFVNGDYTWHRAPNCYDIGPCAPFDPLYTGKKPKCGGGSCSCGPLFLSYDVRFTQDEIDENWQMLLNVAAEEGML